MKTLLQPRNVEPASGLSSWASARRTGNFLDRAVTSASLQLSGQACHHRRALPGWRRHGSGDTFACQCAVKEMEAACHRAKPSWRRWLGRHPIRASGARRRLYHADDGKSVIALEVDDAVCEDGSSERLSDGIPDTNVAHGLWNPNFDSGEDLC